MRSGMRFEGNFKGFLTIFTWIVTFKSLGDEDLSVKIRFHPKYEFQLKGFCEKCKIYSLRLFKDRYVFGNISKIRTAVFLYI